MKELNLAKSSVFLDGGIVLPTSGGLPLTLSVNGSYSASLKSSLKAHLAKLALKDEGNFYQVEN